MSEVQDEGNVAYSDMCLRYKVRDMFYTVMWSGVQVEGYYV